MEKKIEIPADKIRLSFLLILSLYLVTNSISGSYKLAIAINDPATHTSVLILKSFAIALNFLFFGSGALLVIYMLVRNKPSLIIDENGITISPFSNQKVKWNDMVEISEIKTLLRKYIVIKLRNPKEYIDNEANALIRIIMKLNYRTYGTPVLLSANQLKISNDDLLAIIKDNFSAHK